MKIFNDIDTMYSKTFYYDGKTYKCTVCNKKFKSESGVLRHLDKRNCHSERNIFKDTLSEKWIFEIYQMLLKINAPNAHVTLSQFRKKKEFTAIARFFFFCHSRGLHHPMDYMQFVLETYKWKFPVQAVYKAVDENVFIEYRKYRMKNGTCDEINEQFILINENRLYDHDFMLLSLERGEVSYNTLSRYIDMDEFIDTMSDGAMFRFEQFLEMYQE